jgi:hypothetical protein
MAVIGNSPKYTNFPASYFSGNGATTSFTLPTAAGSSTSVLVLIDGVKQFTNTYTLNGTALVFSEAPPTGTNNIEVIPLGMLGQVNTVADSAISTNKIATDAVTTTKILDGNVTFAKLDDTAKRYIQQGDTAHYVSDTGVDGIIISQVEGILAHYRNSTGVFSYIRGTSGGNYNTPYPEYQCRAWVNFNGTGTVAIRGAGNVASITDNGAGSYTINFATAMPDVNYAISGSSSFDGAVAIIWQANSTATYLTTSVGIVTQNTAASGIDKAQISFMVFR